MEKNTLVVKMDILGSLPPELIQEICKFISEKTINNAIRCCNRWNYLIDYNYYWFRKCALEGIKKIEEIPITIFYEDYINKFSSPWKGIYIYNRMTENWKNDNFKSAIVTVPTSPLFKIHHFDDEVLIATTIFNELIVIDSSTGMLQFYYKALDGNYFHYVVRYKSCVIFLEEYYLRYVKFEPGSKLFYIKLNISSSWDMVTYIEAHNGLAAVLDKCIGIFIVLLENLKVVYTNDKVRSVCFADGMIAMGTCNGTIEILNFDFKNLVTLEYHQENVTIWKIMIKNDHLVSFHCGPFCIHGYIVSVWSLERKVCLYTLKDKVYVTPGVKFLNNSLLLCLEKKYYQDTHKIVFLDLNSGKYLLKIDSEEFDVRTVTTNSNHVFTVSNLVIKMWCMRTKNLIKVLVDNVHPFFMKTFEVTETKMAHIRQNGDIELRDYFNCNYLL